MENQEATDAATAALEKFEQVNLKGISLDIVEITKWGIAKGWHLPPACEVPGDVLQNSEPTGVDVELVGTKLMLIVTEIAEAMEELRKGEGHLKLRLENGKPEGLIVELADAYIRIAHLCGMLGLDLETAIEVKKAFNMQRSYRHGDKQA